MAAAIITRLIYGKTDVVQMLNGAIGGLVAVTAEPLAPTPLAAIFIGAIGGLIVVFGTKLLFSFKLDDVVGAIPAHMFAGIWGTLAVPLTNTDASFSAQVIGVLSINIFVFVVSYIVFSIMKGTFICDFCGFLAQVKSSNVKDINKLPSSVLGAAWRPQEERMNAGIYFPLYLVLVCKKE